MSDEKMWRVHFNAPENEGWSTIWGHQWLWAAKLHMLWLRFLGIRAELRRW
jgi:hypothetical protein